MLSIMCCVLVNVVLLDTTRARRIYFCFLIKYTLKYTLDINIKQAYVVFIYVQVS